MGRTTITGRPIHNVIMRRVEAHKVAVETLAEIWCSCGRLFRRGEPGDHVQAFRLHGGAY